MGCQCINDLVQISVHDLIQIVDRQADAVVGAAILREVVSPDLLAAITGSHLPRAVGIDGILLFFCFWASRRLRRISSALSLFWNWLRSFWHSTTIPVGMCVTRMALDVLLMCWPPAPEERKVSMRRSLGR